MAGLIGIVDYGASNIRAVSNALRFIGCDDIEVIRDPDAIATADRLILPGVGTAGAALQGLRDKHLDEGIQEFAARRGRPLLGICLGMQLLAERCLEDGEHLGLSLIEGTIRHLSALPSAQRVPHIGWADVIAASRLGDSLFGHHAPQQFFFAHSYFLEGHNPTIEIGSTTIGTSARFPSAVAQGTVVATQFHPERSQINGVRLLEWFIDWTP